MRIFQHSAYPKDIYFVESFCDWSILTDWMNKNQVEYKHHTTGMLGYGFSLKNNAEWFMLRWS